MVKLYHKSVILDHKRFVFHLRRKYQAIQIIGIFSYLLLFDNRTCKPKRISWSMQDHKVIICIVITRLIKISNFFFWWSDKNIIWYKSNRK